MSVTLYNLGYYFNKGYYDERYSTQQHEEDGKINYRKALDKKSNNEKPKENSHISDFLDSSKYDLKQAKEAIKINGISEETFELTTIYPGLITGMGYAHNSILLDEGEFKNGFYFDYTTGLPVITGSSIKGVIRDAFPNQSIFEKFRTISESDLNNYESFKSKIDSIEDFQKCTHAYSKLDKIKKFILELKIDRLENGNITENFVRKLEEDIFEGKTNDKRKSQVDVFFDAYPNVEKLNHGQSLLSSDYITKHVNSLATEKDDLLKNPIPIKILKIASNVPIIFNFKLVDSEIEGFKITKQKKLELFKNIITEFGVGARRNVGYGQFLKEKIIETQKEKQDRIRRLKREEDENNKAEIADKIERETCNLTESQKKVYFAKMGNSDKIRENVYKLFKERDKENLDKEDCVEIAKLVKGYLENEGKWKYKDGKKDKTMLRIESVCEILSIDLPK